jgi:hypothetical protein
MCVAMWLLGMCGAPASVRGCAESHGLGASFLLGSVLLSVAARALSRQASARRAQWGRSSIRRSGRAPGRGCLARAETLETRRDGATRATTTSSTATRAPSGALARATVGTTSSASSSCTYTSARSSASVPTPKTDEPTPTGMTYAYDGDTSAHCKSELRCRRWGGSSARDDFPGCLWPRREENRAPPSLRAIQRRYFG